MRDNVKATKALVDEYLGARRNVFNDAGEEYEHPHPQPDMFADLKSHDAVLRHLRGSYAVTIARRCYAHCLATNPMEALCLMTKTKCTYTS